MTGPARRRYGAGEGTTAWQAAVPFVHPLASPQVVHCSTQSCRSYVACCRHESVQVASLWHWLSQLRCLTSAALPQLLAAEVHVVAGTHGGSVYVASGKVHEPEPADAAARS